MRYAVELRGSAPPLGNPDMRTFLLVVMLVPLSCMASGCVGTIIGATADAAIEVAKVPFKVGGAVIDVATGDDDDDDEKN